MQSIIELDLFFMQQGKVYQTLANLKDRLTRAGIDYAVIGDMALTIHGYVRATQDVNLLMTAEGLEEFRSSLAGRGFVLAFAGATKMFKDATTGVSVEISQRGSFPATASLSRLVFQIRRSSQLS